MFPDLKVAVFPNQNANLRQCGGYQNHATRAAVEEGIVPGGGVTLVRAAKALEKFQTSKDGAGDPDEQIGVNIVRRALEEPLRQIVQNAGKEGAVVVERVRSEKNENIGFNAATEVFEDLVKAGVIDPAKVTRTALQNAASIAGLMLTTEAMVSELPDEDKGSPAMPGGMKAAADYLKRLQVAHSFSTKLTPSTFQPRQNFSESSRKEQFVE